jgi:hypothetical protein
VYSSYTSLYVAQEVFRRMDSRQKSSISDNYVSSSRLSTALYNSVEAIMTHSENCHLHGSTGIFLGIYRCHIHKLLRLLIRMHIDYMLNYIISNTLVQLKAKLLTKVGGWEMNNIPTHSHT